MYISYVYLINAQWSYSRTIKRQVTCYSKDTAEWRNSGFQKIFYRISRRSKI